MSNSEAEDGDTRNCNSPRSSNDADDNESGMNFNSHANTNGQVDNDREQLIKRMKALTFSDIDEADRYYVSYGQLMGFDVRKHSLGRKHQGSDIIRYRVWVCSRQGQRQTRVKSYNRVRQPKEDLRCDCHALFRVALDSSTGRYRVSTFIPEHNHRLETPDTSHVLRCNRLLTKETKEALEQMTNAGFKPSQVMDYLEDIGGGSKSHVLNRKDAYNYLNGERMKRIEGGDVNTMLGLLEGMKLKDPSLRYKHSVDINNSLTRIFWCDGISRAEYKQFGDVILFDSTYKTNVYRFPIVLLSGVNCHLLTCIFGVAIMYKETTQCYTWLLETFLREMNGKAPRAVLTDQDGAMRAAIKAVFPEATHRLCSWHISRNAKTNITIPGFAENFSNLMNSPCSVPEFEARWSRLISKFGVADHPWIIDIYSKRHQWAEAFFRGTFFSMMRSTQRAESMNANLKAKVREGFTLTDFFKQYNNDFLRKIRNKFHEAQKISEKPIKEVKGGGLLNGLQNHAGRICTRVVFEYILNELNEEKNVLITRRLDPVNQRHPFCLADHSNAKPRKFNVVIDLDVGEFQCECKMLESDGIPCRHLIHGFKNLTLDEFPAKSIHRRWFVDVGKQLTSEKSYQHAYNGHNKMGIRDILLKNVSLGDDAGEDWYDDVYGDEHDTQPQSDGEDSIVNPKRKQNVVDPDKIIPKGGSRSKQQLCSFCRQPGHKSTTCDQNPKVDRAARARANTPTQDDGTANTHTQYDGIGNMNTADAFREPSSSNSQFGALNHIGPNTSLLINMHRNQYRSQGTAFHSQEEGTNSFNYF